MRNNFPKPLGDHKLTPIMDESLTLERGGLGMPFWGFGFENRGDPLGYLELAAAWKPFIETACSHR